MLNEESVISSIERILKVVAYCPHKVASGSFCGLCEKTINEYSVAIFSDIEKIDQGNIIGVGVRNNVKTMFGKYAEILESSVSKGKKTEEKIGLLVALEKINYYTMNIPQICEICGSLLEEKGCRKCRKFFLLECKPENGSYDLQSLKRRIIMTHMPLFEKYPLYKRVSLLSNMFLENDIKKAKEEKPMDFSSQAIAGCKKFCGVSVALR